MLLSFLTLFLLFSCLCSLTEADRDLSHLPRMTFGEKEAAVKKSPLPEHNAPVGIVLQRKSGIVMVAGRKHLNSFDFQNPQKTPREIHVPWTACINNGPPQRNCNYNITLVHNKSEDNTVFLCGSNDKGTMCCDMNLAEQSPRCSQLKEINKSIREFVIKEGEASALVDHDLYVTYSGSQEYVGIHRFGENSIAPASHDKEQHYVGLVISEQKDNRLQNKVYAFYKEKNRETDLDSEMWLPFVTRVCMADRGGPKNTLQSSWTSQMSARLFCGDPDSGQHFSELVDVATVRAKHWQDTRVYALFRNEWNMSAVCVYSIQDVEKIFMSSAFKGTDLQTGRPRECVLDSTTIPVNILNMIVKNSEMKQWVRPVDNSGPLLFNHHSYTHIYVDGSQNKGNNNHVVLFLSLNNGGIHKVMQTKSQTFVIAEYRPFNHSTHILSMILDPSSRKLYVNSKHKVAQMDVANCAHYGNSCQLCVLARDPYCGWDKTQCTPETNGSWLQDVTHGNHARCPSPSKDQGKAFRYSTETQAEEAKDSIKLLPKSKYFLQCPVTSHHAQYTWHHLENNRNDTSCNPREQRCLHLIDSMGPEQEGTYMCVLEEMGYSKVLTQYRLELKSRAADRASNSLIWFCLMAVLIKTMSR